jgi:hypothetical protein
MSVRLGSAELSGDTPAAIAARQRNLVTIWQLRALGLASGTIYGRVASAALRRVHRGVYTVSPAPLSAEAEELAVVLACGPGSGVNRLTAAKRYGVSRFPAPLIEVVSPRRRRITGARVHHCRSLDPRDLTEIDGIPITTMHRLLVDLSDVLTSHQLANVIHEAAYRGRYVEAAVRDVAARMNGRHKLAVLERAMELHGMGSAGTRSGAEDAFLRLDLPEPNVNMHLLGREVDFHWPDHLVVVEVDGIHGRPWSVADDDGRDETLAAAGYTVLRFRERDVHQHQDGVRTRVAAALAGAYERSKAASKATVEGEKSVARTNASASGAPQSRSMPESSHSIESGPW